MKVLILGASGLIGGNLFRHITQDLKWEAIGSYFSYQAKDCVYFNTLDINDSLNFDVRSFNPDVIVHCGALTWVDYCETHEEESHDKTVVSTINAISLAKELNAKFVYISTDYVFDGKDGPYDENAKVNPVNIYGRHKLEAENIVVTSGIDHVICRVTNVYGDEERGKNFIARLIQTAISKKDEKFSFPTDQYATPVNAMDVGKAIGNLLQDNKQGIYNIASTDYFNRHQLAQRVLKYFPEHKVELTPIITSEMTQEAERPLNGGLLTGKYLSQYPSFEFTNVDDYVQKKINQQ